MTDLLLALVRGFLMQFNIKIETTGHVYFKTMIKAVWSLFILVHAMIIWSLFQENYPPLTLILYVKLLLMSLIAGVFMGGRAFYCDDEPC